ncbi:MAG TPA: hypothetical protein VK797_27625 [Tepidisphaeraceae bacterium]|nr:hypothetical protein [Tepidisphaeraceae bacterium]
MSPMPEQQPTLHYASAIPTQRSNWTSWGEMWFALGVAVMALLVILPFFDTPRGSVSRAHSPQSLKLHVFP